MRDAIRTGIMFNIIDTERGQKVDLIPLTMEPRYNDALQRRIRQTFEEASGNQFQAWCARPEDIIIGKLMAWDEGRSHKHEQDILAMLVFIYAKADPALTQAFDETYVDRRALTMGVDVMRFWNELKQVAKKQTQQKLQDYKQTIPIPKNSLSLSDKPRHSPSLD